MCARQVHGAGPVLRQAGEREATQCVGSCRHAGFRRHQLADRFGGVFWRLLAREARESKWHAGSSRRSVFEEATRHPSAAAEAHRDLAQQRRQCLQCRVVSRGTHQHAAGLGARHELAASVRIGARDFDGAVSPPAMHLGVCDGAILGIECAHDERRDGGRACCRRRLRALFSRFAARGGRRLRGRLARRQGRRRTGIGTAMPPPGDGTRHQECRHGEDLLHQDQRQQRGCERGARAEARSHERGLPALAPSVVGSESSPQHGEPAVHTLAHNRRSGSGALRDRARRQVVEKAQRDRGPVGLRQLEYGCAQAVVQLQPFRGRSFALVGLQRGELLLASLASRFCARPTHREPLGDGLQPAAQVADFRPALAEGDDQRLLCQVVCQVVVAQHGARQTVQPGSLRQQCVGVDRRRLAHDGQCARGRRIVTESSCSVPSVGAAASSACPSRTEELLDEVAGCRRYNAPPMLTPFRRPRAARAVLALTTPKELRPCAAS